jgi:hypothetical protein
MIPLTSGQNAPSTGDTSAWVAGAANIGSRIKAFNRWRERYNPLRNLGISRAVVLLEQWQRGEFADPAWVYYFVEGTDPDLFALVERRTSALLELDWGVKSVALRKPRIDLGLQEEKPDPAHGDAGGRGGGGESWRLAGGQGRQTGNLKPEGVRIDATLAAEQGECLREAYEGIDNLYEAIEHLSMSAFRGFAHCEKYRTADGDVHHLELVDQWNVCRDLLRGPWRYNPDALSTTYAALGPAMDINPAHFLIRETRRHIDRLGLVKFIRSNLSQKDWDAFIEIYGIPGGVVTGPQNVPPGKEREYESAAQSIAEGGSGYLPHGSSYVPNQGPRGSQPFLAHLDFLTRKLILAGTGGLLTMLAEPGSGTLAGNAHQDTFETIARAEARRISEIFQKQLDCELLDARFPGRPHLVYFEIAANNEIDPEKICGHALKLRQAGYRIDIAQLSEKTGYTLADAPLPEVVRDTINKPPGPDAKSTDTPAPESGVILTGEPEEEK